MSHWDPFEGQVSPPPENETSSAWAILPASAKRYQGPLLLLAFPGFALAFFGGTTMIVGIALVCIGIFGGLGLDILTGGSSAGRSRLKGAADHLGFAFRGTIPPNRLGAIRRRLPEIFRVRVGGSIPLVIESEMWGPAATEVPCWMGAAAISSMAFFGGPKQSLRGPDQSVQGNTIMMIAAYRLDRDTHVRIVLMPEYVGAVGPLDRDIKTESTDFNNRFNIRLTCRDGEKRMDRATMALLQVLTPAFQTTLTDLADRFAARVIVDRDVVFFAGFRNLQTLDDETLAAFVKETLSEFADAAVSFKAYAE